VFTPQGFRDALLKTRSMDPPRIHMPLEFL
jgi:hypothetical protein